MLAVKVQAVEFAQNAVGQHVGCRRVGVEYLIQQQVRAESNRGAQPYWMPVKTPCAQPCDENKFPCVQQDKHAFQDFITKNMMKMAQIEVAQGVVHYVVKQVVKVHKYAGQQTRKRGNRSGMPPKPQPENSGNAGVLNNCHEAGFIFEAKTIFNAFPFI